MCVVGFNPSEQNIIFLFVNKSYYLPVQYKNKLTDYSIIEFGVYALIGYTSILMLIISTIKPIPITNSLSIIRSMYMLPGVVCLFLLAGAGVNINLDTIDTVTTTTDNQTSTVIFTQATTTTNKIVLLEPVWVLVHYFLAITLLVYVVFQIFQLLTHHERHGVN